eukprot:TRINITY_DN12293_c0_g1_i1.p1 TRINITY_DN12293_c0_g1~~TRINITY_DN12293_c0_g1_i1.p1  ORF type:complete len:224 (-),score=66.59 TRINITY_DN12293_c0_g1_i1:46-681(-)
MFEKLIFGVICLEVALVGAFIIPFVSFLISPISALFSNSIFRKGVTGYLVVVGVLTAETLFELAFLSNLKPDASHDELHHYNEELRLDQRNALLGSITILLVFVLNHIFQASKDLSHLRLNLEVMRKQAKGASDAYLGSLKETAPKDNTAKADDAATAKLTSEVAELKRRLKEKSDDMDAAVKQRDQEIKTLKNRLEDFDLVMGEAVKKAK